MEICARDSIGTKERGIHFVEMSSWHQGGEDHSRLKKACAQTRRDVMAR